MCRVPMWVLLLISITGATSSPTGQRLNWLAAQLEKRIQLQASVDSYIVEKNKAASAHNHQQRTLQITSPNAGTLTRGQVSSAKLPQRVRIQPFDLLLAPTPIQLKRADEDLLLVDMQELIILFMKTQFGNEGSVTNRNGGDTILEYVLFSDIEENSWSEGGEKQQEDPPRTVLRFNGGVASFVGPDIPSEEEVNEWVESAVNGLFAAALAETRYNYIELTQYMVIQDSSSMVHSGDLVVTVPSESAATLRPAPVATSVQSAESPSPELQPSNEEEFPLFHVLVSLLVVIGIVSVILALWIRHNNRAVRVLCLSNRDKEEVVDFCDDHDSPVNISHESGKSHQTAKESDVEEDQEAGHRSRKNDLMNGDNSTASLHIQGSLVANGAVDEASLQSSASEFTIPTVSALSFRNPNPFGKGRLVPQESFQKERKTYISKDMLYSSWSGRAPNLDRRYGRRHDDSVLQPSYFSAAKEWEHLANMAATNKPETHEDDEDSLIKELDAEPLFEAAHGGTGSEDAPDGIFLVGSSKGSKGPGCQRTSQ